MNAKVIKDLRKAIAKNSPTILTGLGVAGVITTAVMAVKATPKALQLLEDERYNRRQMDGPNTDVIEAKDAILIAWKCYAPAAVMGVLTIACIIAANSINLRRNAALAGLYSLSEAALKEYQNKVVETIGKNKELAIRDEIAKDKVDRNPVGDSEVILTGKGETLCYDALCGRYFKSNIEQIRKVLNDVSREMLSDSFVSLNEVYYKLDLTGTKIGDLIGWHVDDGLIEPEFSSVLNSDGTPCLVMDFTTEPRYMYRD
ncbi:MAG: DUF6353 family protein [Syntrophales bacterium]|nr:DUF6353 family protein [Syntrophales bacterium]